MKHMLQFWIISGWVTGLAMGCPALAAAPAAADVRRDATVEAIERVMPSVVNIATEEVVPIRDPMENLFREFFDPYWRHRQPNTQYSLGSGVIIDEEGYVLTNFHVVGRARRVWVKLSDGREFEADKVTGNSSTDVALIKIRLKSNERLTAVRLAADDDLMLGETVLALGNPFGLGASVSKGILSSRSRRPPTDGAPLDILDWLQTDASINPGNSGGALINLKGELIGINVAVLNQAQGIGFAVPIKRVAEKIAEIYSPEWLDSMWFGARVRPGTLPLVVTVVQPESPAELGGLRTGDVVLKAGGREPRSFVDFVNVVRASGAKQDLSLVVQRGREKRTLSVRQIQEKAFFNSDLIRRKLGVTLVEITPALGRRLGLAQGQGLYVESVEPASGAEAARMQRGMIVTSIDGQNADELIPSAKKIHGRRQGEQLRVELLIPVQRGGFYGYRQGAVDLIVR
jgi:S1-C subfamily serine protease